MPTTDKIATMIRLISPVILFSLLMPCETDARTVSPGWDLQGEPCKNFTWTSGALDFRVKTKANLWHYNDSWANHIQPALRQMNTENGKGVGGSASGNLEFVLVRRPNDARALKAVIDYSFIIERHPRHIPIARKPECYLQAAILFQPDDPAPRLLFGYYLMKLKKYNLAIKQYEKVLKMVPDQAEAYYNLGLSYYRLHKLKDAAAAATKAYAFGFPLPFLKNALKKNGYSVDTK